MELKNVDILQDFWVYVLFIFEGYTHIVFLILIDFLDITYSKILSYKK